PDPANTALGAGLDATASYAVLGAYGSFIPGLTAGGKLQIDTASAEITRAGLGASFRHDGYTATLDYSFLAANPVAGVMDDRHEIGGRIGIPVADYWTVSAGAYWDIASNSWLQVGGGLT